MDADDVLQAGAAARLRRHTRGKGYDGVQASIREGATEWLQTRLFRRHARHRFVGRVHEFPRVAGKVIIDRRIVVDHRPRKTGKEGSGERNLRLLLVALNEDPTNKRTLFYLGNTLRGVGRPAEAIKWYKQYLARGASHHCEHYLAQHYLAVCYFDLGRFREAIAAGFAALTIDPRYAETHCLIADCHGELGEIAFARHWYRSALACRRSPPDATLFIERTAYDEHPRVGLELCDERQRQAPR
jgi:tetratricopeptide (TPR) repeat protein